MERPLIVVGQRPGKSLETIYLGTDGLEWEKRFAEAAQNPEFDSVAIYQYPMARQVVHPSQTHRKVVAPVEVPADPQEAQEDVATESETTPSSPIDEAPVSGFVPAKTKKQKSK